MVFSATPSSMPAKIRNRVAANGQANNSSAEQDDADAADGDRPGQVVAGLKTLFSGIFMLVPSFCFPALFRENAPRIKGPSAPV